jgi:hypothetical protein
MTESEWADSTDPQEMLTSLQGKVSERKLRLFAMACCRRAWHLFPEPDVGCQDVVELTERYAEEAAQSGEQARVYLPAAAASAAFAAAAIASSDDSPALSAHAAFAASSLTGSGYADDEAMVWSVAADAAAADDANTDQTERRVQCALLRDIFGNPFRPHLALTPSLLNQNDARIRKLAEATYNERLLPTGHLDPARLAVLVDALLDAGCQDTELLEHLRGPGPHVRGCFALDLLLAKSCRTKPPG